MPKLLFLLFHLVGFAAFAGAAFAQQRFFKLSAAAGLPPAVRDAWERAGATTCARIQLPAIFLSVFSGIGFLLLVPGYLKFGWIHMKLTLVVLLLVVTHLEMFNAKRIARLRVAGNADADIAARKRRQEMFAVLSLVLFLGVLYLAVFKPFGLPGAAG